jgi:D-alanyl-D-alanine carboxypeptidase
VTSPFPAYEVRHAGRVRRGGTSGSVRFRAGGITKSFVATVVLQLVAEGRLPLDGAGITVRHLLQHTSGIPDYGESDRFRDLYGTTEAIVAMRHHSWEPPELLDFIAGQPFLFEPGASWAYSSTDYLVLGELIAQVTGHPYADEVERRILRPLGLRDTRLPGTDPHIDGPHLRGHLGDGVDITVFDQSFAGAAGEIVSSTSDLNRFWRALMTGELLAPPELAAMLGARPTGHGFDYGLGIAGRHLPDGTRLWGHDGGTFGYETFSWTTEDGTSQATVATTPLPGAEPGAEVSDFLTAAFSGRPLHVGHQRHRPG